MKLSILDQAPISKGSNSTQALLNVQESVMLADELGYKRFWLAEHHNSPGLASSAPEISMAYLSAKTSRIRLGSGGMMMMHYSPYKMAEVIKTLSAYAPGRIDFGVGRAPGGDSNAIYALSEGREPMIHNMYQKFDTALKLINEEAPDDPLYQRVTAHPVDIHLPEAWMLGSSGNSAIEAGKMGVGYAYVHFFNGRLDKAVIDAYKASFVPSPYLDKPRIIVSYFVTTAETTEEAEFQAKPADISRMLMMRGQFGVRLSPEEASIYPLTEIEKAMIHQNRNWHIIGNIKDVARQLRDEQNYYGFDEVMICTIPFAQSYKLNEYRLLAKELMSV